jgi:membrane protein
VTGILRRTLEAAVEDNVPFLASALSFDLLLTVLPFLILVLAVIGYLVQHQLAVQQIDVHELIQQFLPGPDVGQGAFRQLEGMLDGIVRERGKLTLFGVPVFLWFSTRLFAGLRVALNEVFDTDEFRPLPVAKLIDLGMVLVTGGLLVVNAYLLALGVRPDATWLHRFLLQVGAVISSTVVFLLIYKILPSRRIGWRTALVAAVFCAVAIEVAKRLFTLYLTRVVTPDRLVSDANVVGFILFLLWIYYSAYVFLLGGEIAETYDLIRMRRAQRVGLG